MSKHHHHQKDQHAPHPATILNGADGAKADDKNLEDSVSEATGEKQLSDFSSDRSGSETPEKSAKTLGKKSDKPKTEAKIEAKADAADAKLLTSDAKSTDSKRADSNSVDADAKSVDAKLESKGDSQGATARWRAVASKAGSKLSELFDEAKAKASEAGSDISKRVAGAADDGVDDAIEAIKAQAKEFMAKGQDTRVRIKLRERELTEVPVAALAAAEAASLWWFGPIRMVLGHMVGRAVLDFEFVSAADPHISAGRSFMASGDIDDAMGAFDQALAADHTSATAHLQRGILLKIRGDKEAAKQAFQRAEECDARGEIGAQAKKLFGKL